MAAKLVHSDNSPELQKQIGCMPGILHLFDAIPTAPAPAPDVQGKNHAHLNPTSMHPSPQHSRQTVDLVKDSIQGLPVKAEEAVAKYQLKISEDSQRRKTPADLKESLTALAKLQQVPKLLRSSFYQSKDGLLFSISTDTPRFSYEESRARFHSADASKSSLKRESSKQGMNIDTKSNLLFNGTFQNQQKVPGNHARPPSVVAKLMGLEAMPNSVPSSSTHAASSQSYPGEDFGNTATSVQKPIQLKPVELTSAAKNIWIDPSSTKPMSKFPIEPAPWKHNDGSKGVSQKPASIEKRLKDVEFTQSGKDLRALKQILEAMQAKGIIEIPKEGQDLYSSSCEDHRQILINSSRSVDKPWIQTSQVLPQTKKKIISAQSNESPIVIMKPVKLVAKSGLSSSVIPVDVVSDLSKLHSCESVDKRKGLHSGRATKDLTTKPSQRVNDSNSTSTRSDKSSKTMQSSTRSNKLVKEGNVGLGSIGPRMQLKKNDSNATGGRRRSKSPIHQKNDDSVESRNLASAQPNLSTVQSDINAEMTCEVSCYVRSVASPSTQVLCDGESVYVPPENSSPVSVLDNMLCKEDSAVPVKHVEKILKADASTCYGRIANPIPAESSVSSSAAFQINRKKLQNINDLVQKLRRLNSSHDEAHTDYIASLCENTNPDHRYVSEILLASGLLLRDPADFQFHPSGHPINPDLFLVLEQTRSSNKEGITRKRGKIHRKLIFDVVDEILARKLVPHSEPWILPLKLLHTSSNAQKLLRQLCCEIDGLRWMNLKLSSEEEADGWKSILCKDIHQAESWMYLKAETSGAVLDIERSIFRDLVNEMVNGASLPV